MAHLYVPNGTSAQRQAFLQRQFGGKGGGGLPGHRTVRVHRQGQCVTCDNTASNKKVQPLCPVLRGAPRTSPCAPRAEPPIVPECLQMHTGGMLCAVSGPSIIRLVVVLQVVNCLTKKNRCRSRQLLTSTQNSPQTCIVLRQRALGHSLAPSLLLIWPSKQPQRCRMPTLSLLSIGHQHTMNMKQARSKQARQKCRTLNVLINRGQTVERPLTQ